MTITLPPDVERRLAQQSRRLGTTPESIVLDSLRRTFAMADAPNVSPEETLFDFLAGHIGTVDGASEPFSEDCGQRFTEALLEGHQRGPL